MEGTSSIEKDIEWKPTEKGLSILSSDDIYQALRIRGYDYGPKFQCLQTYSTKSKPCKRPGLKLHIRFLSYFFNFVEEELDL